MSTPTPATMTAAEIADELKKFIHEDAVTELRALNVGGPRRTVAGWFDGRHLHDLARTALALTRQASGVYFIPNPVHPDLLQRCPNRAEEVRGGRISLTTDVDVLERHFLIVDLDRVDHNGDQSSTDTEVQDAIDAAEVLADDFEFNGGWRKPVRTMSGNGVHLFFPLSVPLPAKMLAHEPDPLRDVLGVCKEWKFRGRVKVDPTTFNAARIIKVPGTWARKGEATAERPHRMARVLSTPDDWPVPCAPPEPPTLPTPDGPAAGETVSAAEVGGGKRVVDNPAGKRAERRIVGKTATPAMFE